MKVIISMSNASLYLLKQSCMSVTTGNTYEHFCCIALLIHSFLLEYSQHCMLLLQGNIYTRPEELVELVWISIEKFKNILN